MAYIEHESIKALGPDLQGVYESFVQVVMQASVPIQVNPEIIITPDLKLRRRDYLVTDLSLDTLISFFTEDFCGVIFPENLEHLPWDEGQKVTDQLIEANLSVGVPALLLRLNQLVTQKM